ncbi:MAG: HlyC/CorC family transporter [Acidaminococcaceae bacterium]|nr:HlyC/CorC family transporter [Acidaminococcaceae bacterium]MBP5736499.1 HlyC/CorC family transporter [Acidaminococcaceae bacterium]
MFYENELYRYLAVLVFFLCCSAFYSASETALSTVNRIRIKNLARNGDKNAEGILKLLEHFDEVLSTILVGNNIVNIATASIATLLCIKLLGDDNSVSIATTVTTIVILIFGEISPKSLAKEYSEDFLLTFHKLLWWNTRLFTPLNFLFKKLKESLSHMISGKETVKPTLTEAELKVMVDEVENEGTISEDESDLIKSAIEFNDIRVREIYTPRVDMVACNITDSNAEIYRLFTTNHFTRIPVYDEEENNIIGLLHAKDFYNSYLKDPKFNLKTILKNIAYVHRSTKISLLLKNFQRNKLQMAAVIDSYGSVAGVVTIEDIMEELVGEIWDEHDDAVSVFHKLGDQRYLVSCDSNSRNASLRDLFEYIQLDFDLYNLENQSISGWVIESLGEIPKKGDTFTYQDLQVEVAKVDQHRLKKIIVTRLPEK